MKNIKESVEKLLLPKLQKYKSETLNTATCVAIYQEIFETFVDLFEGASVKVSNEAMNLVCQLHYDAITINNNQELDPNIFTQRASVKNVETKELALLGSLFSNTPFAAPFILEVKKRS
jgi:hypothetical protein